MVFFLYFELVVGLMLLPCTESDHRALLRVAVRVEMSGSLALQAQSRPHLLPKHTKGKGSREAGGKCTEWQGQRDNADKFKETYGVRSETLGGYGSHSGAPPSSESP